MSGKDVKRVVQYFYSIPEMARILREEQREVEDVYDTLKAAGGEAGHGGGGPGRPVEMAASRAVDKGAWERAGEIGVKLEVLEGDAAAVRACLDGRCGRYKRVLEMRHRFGYSWGKISVTLGVPDSTARNWYHKAVLCLGEALEDVPMADELVGRASRARTT